MSKSLSILKQVYMNLWTNRLRSVLALLGVLIGTASVVTLVSSGQIATRSALQKLRQMGTDLMTVSSYGTQNSDAESAFTDQQIQAISNLNGVASIAPSVAWPVTVHAKAQVLSASVLGVTPDWRNIAKLKMKFGRFLLPMDRFSQHCVVGANVAKNMRIKGQFPVVGAWLRIGQHYCHVIGVAAQWPSNFFIINNLNDSVMLSLTMVQRLAHESSGVHELALKVRPGFSVSLMEARLHNIIKQWKPHAQIYFRNPETLIKQVSLQKKTFTLLLGVIGTIALLVGGIGIMNIMLVSVAERRHEIGLRMALGAKQKDIQILFLSEAILLSAFGGLLGVMLGLMLTGLAAWLSDWAYHFFLMPVLLGFTTSVLIGIFFGCYPAYRASNLNPIVALRGLSE